MLRNSQSTHNPQDFSRRIGLVKPLSLAVSLALGTSAWAGINEWTPYPSPQDKGAGTLIFTANPDTFYMDAISNPYIYKSTNGGKSWQPEPNGFLDSPIAYTVVGSTLYRTIDSGQS